jgi:tRNA pseudouridine55 synthase
MLLLSGAATRLAPCFVGLDKRYETDVDLTSTTSTGDPEGDVLERHAPPSRDELDARLDDLRGEVELPIPAASAVKVGGERAYRLARRGVEVEMPLRRSRVEALDVVAYDVDSVRLDLRVTSGTYVRSIAQALGGGHCTTLRRTAIGPFSISEADAERLVPPSEALARLPGGGRRARARGDPVARARARVGGGAVKVAHAPAELDAKPRAVAIGTFDGVHLGHREVVRAVREGRAVADGRHRSTRTRGRCSGTRSISSRRSSAGSSCSRMRVWRRRSSSSSRRSSRRSRRRSSPTPTCARSGRR